MPKNVPNTVKQFNDNSNKVAKFIDEEMKVNFMLLGLASDGVGIISTLHPEHAIKLLKAAIASYEDPTCQIFDKGSISDM